MGAKDADIPTHVPAITRAARPRPLLLPPAGTEDIVPRCGRMICARVSRETFRPLLGISALDLSWAPGENCKMARQLTHFSIFWFVRRQLICKRMLQCCCRNAAKLPVISMEIVGGPVVGPQAKQPARLPQHPDNVACNSSTLEHLNNLSVASVNFHRAAGLIPACFFQRIL